MYGFVCEIAGENEVLVKPFWEEALVTVLGTEEQITEIHMAKEAQNREQESMPIVIFYDDDSMILEEEETYAELAG